MKILNIGLRGPLNANSLRLHLYRFFKNTSFDSQYVLVYIKFTNSKNVLSKSLGMLYPIDLSNSKDIREYKKYITKKFDSKFNSYAEEELKGMQFHYKEINKEEYLTLVEKISKKESLFDNLIDEGIPNDLNIPLDTNYSDWGNTTILSKSSFSVSDCNFNDQIEKLVVNQND